MIGFTKSLAGIAGMMTRSAVVRGMAAALTMTAVLASGPSTAQAANWPGQTDGTFATHGVLTLDGALANFSASELAATGSGSVIVGAGAPDDTNKIGVAHIGVAGKLTSYFNNAISGFVQVYTEGPAIVESSGRTVVAAEEVTPNATAQDLGLLAFDVGGKLDSSFAGAGNDLIVAGNNNEIATVLTLAQDAGGTLTLVTDEVNSQQRTEAIVIRQLAANGTVLSSARHTIAYGGNWQDAAAAVLKNGVVLVGGSYDPASSKDNQFDIPRIIAINPDGTLDQSFGSGGVVQPGGDWISISQIREDSAGRVLVAGGHEQSMGRSGPRPVRAYLLRLTAGGKVDQTFGANGVAGGWGPPINSLLLQPNGQIVTFGYGADGNSDLTRYNASNGAPDLSFGYSGTQPIMAGSFVASNPIVFGANANTIQVLGLVYPTKSSTYSALWQGHLAGSTARPAIAHTFKLTATNGRSSVQVPDAVRASRLSGSLVVPYYIRGSGDAEEGYFVPQTTRVFTGAGTVRLVRPDAIATVSGATFSLRAVKNAVAAIDLSSPGAGKTTTVWLTRGTFKVTVGHLALAGKNAKIVVHWRRHGAPNVTVVSGHLIRSHFPGQLSVGAH